MIVVVPAAPSDLRAAAAVLAECFADDPVTGAVVGGPEHDRLERSEHLFLGLLRPAIAAGTVDVARRAGDPDVLGVALWEAPGVATSVVRLAAGIGSFWRAGSGPAGIVRQLTAKQRLHRHRPRRPHWYLQEIGVAAHARGSGVGGALLHARLACVDAADAAAYLESSTEQNRRLYRRHGFVDVAPVRGVEGVPMAMWRPPASERAVDLGTEGRLPSPRTPGRAV